MSQGNPQLPCSLEDVLLTHELARRPAREPNHAAENRALTELVREMSSRPEGVLQKVTDLAMELCGAESAGISILEPGGDHGLFRWHAISGLFSHHLYGTLPREASPCGIVLDRNCTLLFYRPERYFAPLQGVEPGICEALLIPWMAGGELVGTLWTLHHKPEKYFDMEDVRVLSSLAGFASAAHQMIAALMSSKAGQRDLERKVAERTYELRAGEERLRADLAGMRRLYDLHARIAVETDLKAALDQILTAACEFTRTDRGCIQLAGEDGRLEVFNERGYEEGREEESIRAAQSTPMIGRSGETVGVLSTQFTYPHRPAEEELRLLGLLAWTAADFVERHRAEKALRESERQRYQALDTARRLAEEAHRLSGARYRALFDSIDEGFCIIEMLFDSAGRAYDYRFLEMNPAFEKHTGLGNAVGKTVRDFVPDHDEHWFRIYGEVARTGVPVRFEQTAESLGRYYRVYAFPVEERGSDQVAVLFTDITERKRMADALQASEQRLQQVFAQAPVAFAVLRGRELVFEMANPAYRDFLPGRELVGRRLQDVMPEITEELLAILYRVLETGEPFVGNEYLAPIDKDRDGTPENCWFTFLYQPWREAGGAIVGIFVVAVDVTTHVRSRLELERLNKELEEFAYVAGHDLQEPLRMVNIYSHLILSKLDGSAELKEYGEFVRQGVRRMEDLIRDLLTYSRAIQDEQRPLGVASLSAALNEACTVLRWRIEDARAEIHAGALPEVGGDVKQLAHVFQNLIGNSLKYRNAETSPVIHITAERRQEHYLIAVRDNGIGFEPQYAEKIFGLFRRLHRDEYPGTGLGLAICQRIVERFGGRIWAESKPNEGAAFFFTLPVRERQLG